MHHVWMCGLRLFTKGPKKLTTLNGTQSRKALQLVCGAVQAALSLGPSSSEHVNTRMLEWNLWETLTPVSPQQEPNRLGVSRAFFSR